MFCLNVGFSLKVFGHGSWSNDLLRILRTDPGLEVHPCPNCGEPPFVVHVLSLLLVITYKGARANSSGKGVMKGV